MAYPSPISPPFACRKGFTLLEILTAITVLALILTLCLQMTNHFNSAIGRTRETMGVQSEGARTLALIASQIRQAVVAPRPLLVSAAGERVLTQSPSTTSNWSDLMFVTGPESSLLPGKTPSYSHAIFFQCALGDPARGQTGQGLNEIGYYLESNDGTPPPFVTNPPNRLRLMQLRRRPGATSVQTIQENARLGSAHRNDWFTDPIEDQIDTQPVANNILALIIVPKVKDDPSLIPLPPTTRGWSTFPNYSFDSQATGQWRHRLPQQIEITLIVGSEESLTRYAQRNPGTQFDFGQSSLFSTLASTSAHQANLDAFLAHLDSEQIFYEVFTTTVRLEAGSQRL